MATVTAAQKRAQTKAEYDAFLAACPSRKLLELTDLGLSLHQMMRGIKTWAEMHMDDVFAHRATYDTRLA